MTQERCPDCGKFCGVVYRWRGPILSEVPSCTSCGLNVPKCSHEDGTVKGCQNNATHEGAFQENHIDRYWCEEHRPENAEQLPYVE